MNTKLYDITDWCRLGTEIEDYPYMGEVDDVSIGEVVHIDENYYVIGMIGRNEYENSAGCEKIELNLNPNDKNERNIVCPYCNYEENDSGELRNDDEYECGRCRAVISYQRIITVEYNSSPKTPPEVVKAKWVSK